MRHLRTRTLQTLKFKYWQEDADHEDGFQYFSPKRQMQDLTSSALSENTSKNQESSSLGAGPSAGGMLRGEMPANETDSPPHAPRARTFLQHPWGSGATKGACYEIRTK